MVRESWLSTFRRKSRKAAAEPDKAVVGILTYEIATLMSRLVKLWHSLSDKEFSKVKEDISSLDGIKKLISISDSYIMELVLKEIIENLGYLACSTAKLANKCTDPVFHHFERFVKDPSRNDFEWFGWEYRWKKMEKKVKKMERLVGVTTQLIQELEVLAELEQTLRRMQVNPDLDRVRVLEFQQKVLWQRQEVGNLRAMCPWNRTYDYIVRLLMRSIFTIVERIKLVFGLNVLSSLEGNNGNLRTIIALPRSHSFSALRSSVHPTENNISGFYSGPLGKSTVNRKQLPSKSNQLTHIGLLKGCIDSRKESHVLNSCQPVKDETKISSLSCRNEGNSISFFFKSKYGLSSAPTSTLGSAALALHYANVIILIEKLASTPHLIGLDAREDLYNMLPTTIRATLRARLTSQFKTVTSSAYDAALASEWSLVIIRILEWLSPLARNMIKWHCERTIEKHHVVSWTHVLLVQTLHYADQEKTEAAITDLLVGLNYICKSSGELYRRDQQKNTVGFRAYHNNLCYQNDISFYV